MPGEVIPFGKYKGQPVEVLSADRGYTDWLMGQAWFRERYGNMYTLIVNNFGEATETPEHNALQGLFLSKIFAAYFIEKVAPGHMQEYIDEANIEAMERINELKELSIEDESKYIGEITRLENAISSATVYVKVKFEEDRADVVLFSGYKIDYDYCRNGWYRDFSRRTKNFRIEIKPSVGDDYPAILRQMKANQCEYLFVGEYHGIGVTKEQFVEIFKISNIMVVFRDEIPA